MATLTDDLRKANSHLEELRQAIKGHEDTISSKTREIATLEYHKVTSTKAQEAADQIKTELNVKVEGLRSEVAAREREKQAEVNARQKMEKELDDLRKVMAAKTSEDQQRREADRSREQEMGRLREQAAQLQKSLDDQRETALQIASKLRVDVEGLKQSHTAAQKELKARQAEIIEKEREIGRMRAGVTQMEGERRKMESELSRLKERHEETERKLLGTMQARDVST